MECESKIGRAKNRSRSCMYAFIKISNFSSISTTFIKEMMKKYILQFRLLFNYLLILIILASYILTERSTLTTREAKLIFDA